MANDYKDQQLVYAVRSDDEQAKAKQEACEKGYIQSKRLNTAHTEMDNIKRRETQAISKTSMCNRVRNHSEQAREKQKIRKRHYIQKKRLDTA